MVLDVSFDLGAGWSSPVARWAHNPKVAGSNPAPATKSARGQRSDVRGQTRLEASVLTSDL